MTWREHALRPQEAPRKEVGPPTGCGQFTPETGWEEEKSGAWGLRVQEELGQQLGAGTLPQILTRGQTSHTRGGASWIRTGPSRLQPTMFLRTAVALGFYRHYRNIALKFHTWPRKGSNVFLSLQTNSRSLKVL